MPAEENETTQESACNSLALLAVAKEKRKLSWINYVETMTVKVHKLRNAKILVPCSNPKMGVGSNVKEPPLEKIVEYHGKPARWKSPAA